MTISKSSKSILAKLLANENLEVIYREGAATAQFDVKNRRLLIPDWANLEKDLLDLFIGHEVGHALETPGNVDFKTLGVPFSYINVVEDIRIENKILSRYPGLVLSFKNGYDDLFEQDFFGLKRSDIVDLNFIDRLNVKSKLRDRLEVPFLENERPLFDMALGVETWDDTVEVARKLYEFMKEEEKAKQAESASDDDDSNDSYEFDDTESDDVDGSDETESESDDVDGSDESESESDDVDGSDESEENDLEKPSTLGKDRFEHNVDEINTQTTFETNKEQLVSEQDHLMVEGLQSWQIKECTINAETFFKGYTDYEIEIAKEKYKKTFLDKNKKQINHLVNGFNRKKAAFVYSKAKTSKTGDIDVNKLHSYKTDENIFKTVTKLAKGKNHGMLFLIDLSGSMINQIKSVCEQTLLLTEFCQIVKIPFDVYTFTSTSSINSLFYERSVPFGGLLEHRNIMLGHCLSSGMKKQEIRKYSAMLYDSVEYRIHRRMGGTPLDTLLTGLPHIIDKFIEKNQIQKLILNILTDGASHTLAPVGVTINYNSKLKIHIHKKIVNVTGQIATKNLLEHLKMLYPSMKLIGYFIETLRQLKGIRRCITIKTDDEFNRAKKTFHENGIFSSQNVKGYDRYFVLDGTEKRNETAVEKVIIDNGASRTKISGAFMKSRKSIKKSRIFLDNFISEIC